MASKATPASLLHTRSIPGAPWPWSRKTVPNSVQSQHPRPPQKKTLPHCLSNGQQCNPPPGCYTSRKTWPNSMNPLPRSAVSFRSIHVHPKYAYFLQAHNYIIGHYLLTCEGRELNRVTRHHSVSFGPKLNVHAWYIRAKSSSVQEGGIVIS